MSGTGKPIKSGALFTHTQAFQNVHMNHSNFQSLFYITAFQLCYYIAAEANVNSQNTTYNPKQNKCFWNRYNDACCYDAGLTTAIVYKLQLYSVLGRGATKLLGPLQYIYFTYHYYYNLHAAISSMYTLPSHKRHHISWYSTGKGKGRRGRVLQFKYWLKDNALQYLCSFLQVLKTNG